MTMTIRTAVMVAESIVVKPESPCGFSTNPTGSETGPAHKNLIIKHTCTQILAFSRDEKKTVARHNMQHMENLIIFAPTYSC